jgi:hypothetical protein
VELLEDVWKETEPVKEFESKADEDSKSLETPRSMKRSGREASSNPSLSQKQAWAYTKATHFDSSPHNQKLSKLPRMDDDDADYMEEVSSQLVCRGHSW